MGKASRHEDDDLRPEYDFASMKGGVRGKYVARLRKGSNLVLLEPEVAAAFPSDDAVNEALRGVLNTTRAVRGKGGLPNSVLQPTRRATPRAKKAIPKSETAFVGRIDPCHRYQSSSGSSSGCSTTTTNHHTFTPSTRGSRGSSTSTVRCWSVPSTRKRPFASSGTGRHCTAVSWRKTGAWLRSANLCGRLRPWNRRGIR